MSPSLFSNFTLNSFKKNQHILRKKKKKDKSSPHSTNQYKIHAFKDAVLWQGHTKAPKNALYQNVKKGRFLKS